MNTIRLNGAWKLYYFPQGEFLVETPEQLSALGCKSVEAVVPGNVELDLERAGELPDPFFADNIKLLRPYELYEWWYVNTFATPDAPVGQPVELVFHGVDCLAEYWLNGERIGATDNMLIEHRLDVTGKLSSDGSNTLAVRLSSPILGAMDKSYDPAFHFQPLNWEALWIRKAAHSYSWDIMPRAVSAGIWRSVELVVHDQHEISDLYVYTLSAGSARASMRAYFELRTDPRILSEISLELEGTCGTASFRVEKDVYFTHGTFQFDVKQPKLWWPRGYGEPHLYELTARLKHKGKVLAEKRQQLGIRTAELIRTEVTSKERPGEFLFKVNQTPIWVKGTNWVPADAFHSRDASRYEPILDLCRDLNCNMLRCWGGNVYEDHAFFDYCDRHGIMVWQDFAMACSSLPQVEEFWNQIRVEAAAVIRKLRPHPSIVVWSGDNENDQVAFGRGLDPAANKITREILPAVVAQCDPIRPFLPSSPYFSPEVIARKDKQLMPEQHLWGPRDYYKSKFYTESTAHFISEIGYHGCPNLSSIRKFIDEEHLWPWKDNEQWLTHASAPAGKDGPFAGRIQLMANQIAEMFGEIPSDMENFILASQISQAEAKKFFIEMVRTRKPRRTGVLWWNVIDGWPQFSDAVVDYYFGKKLAYHYIKRVQQPLCIMLDEPEGWHVRVVAGNDSNEEISANFRITDADSGKTVLEGDVAVQANRNQDLGKIRVSHGEQKLFLIQWTAKGETYGNHYLLGSPPFSLEKYKSWLRQIAGLPYGFNADEVGK